MVYTASVRFSEYALIQVAINYRALGDLQAVGAEFRNHPAISGYSMGRELVIPVSAFPVFNSELAAGRILFNTVPGP
jgi:hypothetical protein